MPVARQDLRFLALPPSLSPVRGSSRNYGWSSKCPFFCRNSLISFISLFQPQMMPRDGSPARPSPSPFPPFSLKRRLLVPLQYLRGAAGRPESVSGSEGRDPPAAASPRRLLFFSLFLNPCPSSPNFGRRAFLVSPPVALIRSERHPRLLKRLFPMMQ